ncbi:integrase [Ktedonobacteria bacterium brp13]|nr:integrase [Ktedonobacteria bacterium brp13]
MNQTALSLSKSWQWPINMEAYDRSFEFSEQEWETIESVIAGLSPSRRRQLGSLHLLHRLFQPIDTIIDYVAIDWADETRRDVFQQTHLILTLEMYRRKTTFWAWSAQEWLESMGSNWSTFAQRYGWSSGNCRYSIGRTMLATIAYFLSSPFPLDLLVETFEITSLAKRVFGKEHLQQAITQMTAILQSWGYQERDQHPLKTCVSYLLLLNRSPYLEDLSTEILEIAGQNGSRHGVQKYLFQASRALFALGIIQKIIGGEKPYSMRFRPEYVSEEWLSWCDKWRKQSTLQSNTIDHHYALLRNVGRWLKKHHPEVTSPAHWTYELAIEYVRSVIDLKVGEWADPGNLGHIPAERMEQPLSARAKSAYLSAMRAFFRDCQEWNWVSFPFNPLRVFRTPRSVKSLIGPNPRVVDRAYWAKLLWSAMNLQEEDLPLVGKAYTSYPLEMVRAIAVVWCFAALRSNEIARLRLGCIRWQQEEVLIPETGERLAKDAICLLDIPVNKTSTAYTKPVSTTVGKYINEWEKIRPKDQPRHVDKKTGETVEFLFSYRGRRISANYVNRLIPVLCQKAGIPEQDSRGTITSHRARATIASMLYNAKDPLDIFQLQQYLGHKYLSSTQHYAQVDPTKLALDVAKAGYLEQNLATIEVLLDQDAVRSGAAAAQGEAWKYYDLGHGYCTNDFWADCKHRMACARCPFYRPKDSLKNQLVEGSANLVRMLEFVTLTEEERLLITEGIELHRELIAKLADTPTPAGPTPRELNTQRQAEAETIPLQTIQRAPRKGTK